MYAAIWGQHILFGSGAPEFLFKRLGKFRKGLRECSKGLRECSKSLRERAKRLGEGAMSPEFYPEFVFLHFTTLNFKGGECGINLIGSSIA